MSKKKSSKLLFKSLLFQTGYLSIKGANEDGKYLFLGFPNKEVAYSFCEELLPYSTSKLSTSKPL